MQCHVAPFYTGLKVSSAVMSDCSLIGTEKDDVSSLLSLKLRNLLCHVMVLSYYLLKVIVFLRFLCQSNMPTLILTGTVEDTC